MQTKIERLPKSKIKMEIEVSAKKMAEYLKHAFEKLAAKVEIKGFRAGKAPKSLLIEQIGHSRLIQEAMDIALPQTYYLALSENKLTPLNPPSIVMQKPLEFDGVEFDSASKLV